MKFRTLKDFWEWLTISKGDLIQDFESVDLYTTSKDVNLLTFDQVRLLSWYRSVLHKLSLEQQELELK